MTSFLQVEVDQPVQLTPDSRAKHEAELLMLFSRHDEDGDGKMKVDAGWSGWDMFYKLFATVNVQQAGGFHMCQCFGWKYTCWKYTCLNTADHCEKEGFWYWNAEPPTNWQVREFCRLISAVDEAFSAISAMKMFEAAETYFALERDPQSRAGHCRWIKLINRRRYMPAASSFQTIEVQRCNKDLSRRRLNLFWEGCEFRWVKDVRVLKSTQWERTFHKAHIWVPFKLQKWVNQKGRHVWSFLYRWRIQIQTWMLHSYIPWHLDIFQDASK